MKAGAWDLTTAQIWAVALNDLGMTFDMFGSAFRKSLTLEWMPSTPKDFYNLAVLGDYPDIRWAYMQACDGKYQHQVIYETACRVGFYELRNLSEQGTYGTWCERYMQVCQEHRRGARFALPTSRQVEHKITPADKNTAQKYLDQILMNMGKASMKKTNDLALERVA